MWPPATAQNVNVFSLFSIIGHCEGPETSPMTFYILVIETVYMLPLPCLEFNGDLQEQNLVKDKPKMPILPLNPAYPIWCPNIVQRYLQWLSMVYKIENEVSAGVLVCLGVYGALDGQILFKSLPKIPILPPWIQYPIWYFNYAEASSMTFCGYLKLKMVYQDAFRLILTLMVIFKATNWSNICQKIRILPHSWIPSIHSAASIVPGYRQWLFMVIRYKLIC